MNKILKSPLLLPLSVSLLSRLSLFVILSCIYYLVLYSHFSYRPVFIYILLSYININNFFLYIYFLVLYLHICIILSYFYIHFVLYLGCPEPKRTKFRP